MADKAVVHIYMSESLRREVKEALAYRGHTMTYEVKRHFESIVREHKALLAGRTQVHPSVYGGDAA